MAGLMVPVVIFPRFTGLIGASAYNSLAIDVTAFYELRLSMWRSPLVGTGASFAATVAVSMDRTIWDDIPGGSAVDPGANTEVEYVLPINKRWLRVTILLSGTNPGTTCWATGYLIKREK
jgi:hypothetical protein